VVFERSRSCLKETGKVQGHEVMWFWSMFEWNSERSRWEVIVEGKVKAVFESNGESSRSWGNVILFMFERNSERSRWEVVKVMFERSSKISRSVRIQCIPCMRSDHDFVQFHWPMP
jgi:hypothetical protein